MGRANWLIAERQRELAKRLAKELNIHPVAADVLIQRGFGDEDTVRTFLNPNLSQLHDPYLLRGMGSAVQRIKQAITAGEQIIIYGDYDVDGLTSTALLVRYFRDIGVIVRHYIPKRLEEGYGLHQEAIMDFARQGADLVITVDCGITAAEAVGVANRLGIDVIVTDHHTPDPARMPEALSVINPKLPDQAYPFQELCGAGVALKLVQALSGVSVAARYLDLVALGTIADVVPLIGENRVFVKFGLAAMQDSRIPGLGALLAEANISSGPGGLKPGQVSFMLAPRLNAAGRLNEAEKGLELLLTEDLARAQELAAALSQQNAERQAIEQQIMVEAEELLARESEDNQWFIVLAKPGWHHGVIGIVASRLMERYHRPVILLGIEGEEAKGSGRSISGYSLIKALQGYACLLINYGGHDAAAGLTLHTEQVVELRRQLNEHVRVSLSPEQLLPKLRLDGELDPSELTLELVRSLESLGPYGPGHPEPAFCSRSWQLADTRLVGKEKQHLKLSLRGGGMPWDVMAFRRGEELGEIKQHGWLDLAYSIQSNEWNGRESVVLHLRDWREPAQSTGLAIYDARHLLQRDEYLFGLLGPGQAALAVFWPDFADSSWPELWQSLGCRPGEGRQGPVYILQAAGKWQVVDRIEPSLITDLIWLDVPFRAAHLQALVEDMGPNLYRQRIHLLYNGNDIDRAYKLLEINGPNRQALGTFYLGLKAHQTKQLWTFAELGQLMQQKGYVPLRCHLEFYLRVLAELSLIQCEEASGNVKLRVRTEVREKRDLQDSPLFAAAEADLQFFAAWREPLRGPDAANLLARHIQSIAVKAEEEDIA